MPCDYKKFSKRRMYKDIFKLISYNGKQYHKITIHRKDYTVEPAPKTTYIYKNILQIFKGICSLLLKLYIKTTCALLVSG